MQLLDYVIETQIINIKKRNMGITNYFGVLILQIQIIPTVLIKDLVHKSN